MMQHFDYLGGSLVRNNGEVWDLVEIFVSALGVDARIGLVKHALGLGEGSTAPTGKEHSMSLFKTQAELTLKPLFFDLVYRLSCVSSAYVLKGDMECSFPVDAVAQSVRVDNRQFTLRLSGHII